MSNNNKGLHYTFKIGVINYKLDGMFDERLNYALQEECRDICIIFYDRMEKSYKVANCFRNGYNERMLEAINISIKYLKEKKADK